MSHYPFWPVTVVALFAAFMVVAGRMKRKAQPLRLELADQGGAVLACPDTSDSGKHLVNLYLDSAFTFRGHLLLAHLVVPVVAFVHAFDVLKHDGKAWQSRERNPQVRAAIERMTDLHLRITLANHPLLCTSVLLSVAVWFTVAAILVVIVSGIIPSRVPAEEIAERVDYAYARIPVRLRGASHAHGCA